MTGALAVIVVLGSFGYFIFRGGGDQVVVPIIAGALGMVLSYFFAHQIANGAADKALAARISEIREIRSQLREVGAVQPNGESSPRRGT